MNQSRERSSLAPQKRRRRKLQQLSGTKNGGQMEGEKIRKSPLATMHEAAEYLHVCQRTVTNLQVRGLLETRYIGKRRFFTWASLEKLARNGAPLNG